MATNSQPDYYRILQVHPEAEGEVIEAAYHRLAKKYHPDALDPSQRDDPEMGRMARLINEAYDTLGDPAKRAAYDAGGRAPGEPESKVEKRTISGRCSKTHQEFDILLARKRGSDDHFKVVGFTPVAPKTGLAKRDSGPLAVIGRVFQPKQKPGLKGEFGAPSDAELEAMFDEGYQLNFSDIDWDERLCPACSGQGRYPDGALGKWCVCGGCSKIACMGSSTIEKGELYTACPWCGTRHTVNRVGKGGKSRYSVQSNDTAGDIKRLGGRASLPGGDKKGLPE